MVSGNNVWGHPCCISMTVWSYAATSCQKEVLHQRKREYAFEFIASLGKILKGICDYCNLSAGSSVCL